LAYYPIVMTGIAFAFLGVASFRPAPRIPLNAKFNGPNSLRHYLVSSAEDPYLAGTF
jgi:hypothetical protein